MYLGAILGSLGASLGTPWGHLGAIFGPSWGHLGAILGRLGDKLGQLWGANTKALNNTLFDDSVVGPHARFCL